MRVQCILTRVDAVHPSETNEGRRWLANFPPDDLRAATILLDSLHFISATSFRAGLTDLLSEVIEDHETESPIVIYPVRPPPKDSDYFEPAPERPWTEDAGSEHIVANIITETVRRYKASHQVSAHGSIEQLRHLKARTIILVEDYTGSGSTISSYLDRWWANPTIKSWRSLGLIRFILVVFACSSTAKAKLHHRLLDDIRWVEYGLDFASAHWSDEERTSIRELCVKYARNRSLARGYKNSEGLIVIGHVLPNNLPIIFRTGKGASGSWAGFFPSGSRRISPSQQLRLADYRPEADLEFLAARLRHPRLAYGYLKDAPGARPLLLMLAALTRPPRTDDWLMQELEFTVYELQRILQGAQDLKLIDEHRHLTDQGRAVLRHAERKPRIVRFELHGSDEPYYPVSLRGAR